MKKVKELFTKHFPEVTLSDAEGTQWLESVLENLKQQIVSNKSSLSNSTTTNNNNNSNSPIANNVTNNNHLNNCSEVETNNLNNSAVNGDSNSSTSSVADNELVLQNAQLKTTVEEYKNIIAETVSLTF